MKIKVIHPFLIAGKHCKTGDTVEVNAQLARELVSRGRAAHIAEAPETPAGEDDPDDKKKTEKKK